MHFALLKNMILTTYVKVIESKLVNLKIDLFILSNLFVNNFLTNNKRRLKSFKGYSEQYP